MLSEKKDREQNVWQLLFSNVDPHISEDMLLLYPSQCLPRLHSDTQPAFPVLPPIRSLVVGSGAGRNASDARGEGLYGGGAPRGRGGGQDGGRWVILPGFLQAWGDAGAGVPLVLPAGRLSPAPGGLLLSFLQLGGGPASPDTMSDSEEESQDRQLKIVVLGDGTSGKVSPRANPVTWAAGTTARPGRAGPWGSRALSSAASCSAVPPTWPGTPWAAAFLAPAPCARARRPPARLDPLLGWATAKTDTDRDDAQAERAPYTVAALSGSHLTPVLPLAPVSSFNGCSPSSRGGRGAGGREDPCLLNLAFCDRWLQEWMGSCGRIPAGS